MTTWSVHVLNDSVVKELDALDPSLRASFARICELLEEFGPVKVGAPYVRHLTGALWEIRMKGKGGIARAIYATAHEKRIVVLHVFLKKTQKTPRSAIQKASVRWAKGV